VSETNVEDLQKEIDSLNPEARVLFAEAVLGRDAQSFVDSELGRYIVGCAQEEIRTAYGKLKTVSPIRIFKVQELQNEIWRAEQLLAWLQDLIVSGTRAMQVLDKEPD
jgi:hypothetical protein